MTVAIHQPRMTREKFLDWPGHAEGRHEFDGFQPVAMTGGNLGTAQIAQNLYAALRSGLAGKPCRALGPDAGVATVGDAVRYPDALVTCTKVRGSDRLTPGVVIVFEIVSPTSGRTDRIVKVREYHAVPSILRYVIVEHRYVGATVLARSDGTAEWTATTLASGDILDLPEVAVAFPLDLLYEGTDVAAENTDDASATQP